MRNLLILTTFAFHGGLFDGTGTRTCMYHTKCTPVNIVKCEEHIQRCNDANFCALWYKKTMSLPFPMMSNP